MQAIVRPSIPRSQQHWIAWALAVVLPAAACWVTAQFSFMYTIPFALAFVSIAFLSVYAGTAQAILATFVAIACHNILLSPPYGDWSLSRPDQMRATALLVSALFISLMNGRRKTAKEAHESAMLALEERNADLVLAQQGSRCAAWTYDPRDRPRWHRGGFEVFGIPFDEVEKLPSSIPLIASEDRERVRSAILNMIETRGPMHFEYRCIWPNGEVHWSEVRGTPLPGEPPIWRGVTFDITERKLAEAALLRTEKLAAMGRLASTVAHEVNNPLESVTNLLYLANQDPALCDETKDYLAMAEKELARLANITRLTLGSVRSNFSRGRTEVAAICDEVLSSFDRRIEMKQIQIDRLYSTGVFVYIAPHELRQIVTNLVANAIDACSPPNAVIRLKMESDETAVVLSCQENGSGIDASHLPRIFEPFFTTKEDVGTGIGLWVTSELTKYNGGSISVTSGELEGGMRTSFRVQFPTIADSAS